ncbi:MAG TPA: hypothetical protein VNA87_05535 [Actinomycetota bacterium]|nr:hypothetical protein [Actinomycetota bacterium]
MGMLRYFVPSLEELVDAIAQVNPREECPQREDEECVRDPTGLELLGQVVDDLPDGVIM